MKQVSILIAMMTLPVIAFCQEVKLNTDKPNIFYIVLDDVGFSDLGCYGSEIATPNIDELANEGIRFNNFTTRAICSATRAALLTGRNNQTAGMMDIADLTQDDLPYTLGYIRPETGTVAQILKKTGYVTTLSGKWHLSPQNQWSASSKTKFSWPTNKGFDNFYGWLGGWTDQYNPSGPGREMLEGDHKAYELNAGEEHVSIAIVDKAIRFLRDGFAKYPDKPEFVYLGFGAAHSPYQVPERYINQYLGVYEQGWDVLRKKRFEKQKRIGVIPENSVLTERSGKDPSWEDQTSEQKAVFSRFMATYAGFLTHTDEQIGRFIKYLKDVGQFDNSIIFLISDNGAAPEAGLNGGFFTSYGDTATVHTMFTNLGLLGTEHLHPLYQRPWAWLGGTPFKKYKLFLDAGGIKDPLIVTWPKKIFDRGGIRNQYVDVTDITPTVLDILGISAPKELDGAKQIDMAGNSFQKVLEEPQAISIHHLQFFSLRGDRAIYQDGWKAIAIHKNGTKFDDDKWELYNTNTDYSEAIDIADKFPQKLNEL